MVIKILVLWKTCNSIHIYVEPLYLDAKMK